MITDTEWLRRFGEMVGFNPDSELHKKDKQVAKVKGFFRSIQRDALEHAAKIADDNTTDSPAAFSMANKIRDDLRAEAKKLR